MPFQPEGFLQVAVALQGAQLPTGEGRHRTIAGRAYYSAFWATCVAVCQAHGIMPTDLPHQPLCMKLASADDNDVGELGNVLNSLRLRRVHADYKLALPLDEDAADDAIADARRVFELLPKVKSRLPRVDP